MKVVETKKRHLVKTISWRVLATINSFLILSIGWDGNLFNFINWMGWKLKKCNHYECDRNDCNVLF